MKKLIKLDREQLMWLIDATQKEMVFIKSNYKNYENSENYILARTVKSILVREYNNK